MSGEKDSLERRLPRADHSLIQPDQAIALDYTNSYGNGYADGDDSHLDPSLIIKWYRAVVRRKWLIITITVSLTGIVILDVYRTRDTYQASTLVEIGRENTTLVRSGDILVQNDDSIKTKVYIIQSTPLLEDVIISLKLDENSKFLDMGKKSFREGIESLVDRVFSNEKTDSHPQALATATSALQSDKDTRSAAESDRLQPFVTLILKNLTVEEIKDTRLLRISFKHTDPSLAAAVCNAIAQDFIQRSFESRTDKFTKASDWLARQTRELKDKAEQAEQALANYTREHGIVSTENKETLITERLTRLHAEALKAETDRMLKQSLFEEVRQGHVAQIPEAFADPQTVTLRKRLNELEITNQQLSVKYGPDNPQVKEVQEQLAATQEQLVSNTRMLADKLKIDYERAVRDELAFKAMLDQAKAEAVTQNQASIQYNVLLQELETAKSLYKDFLQKTNQADFEVGQQRNNVRVIEPALVPRVTSSPNRRQMIFIGFLVGLAASTGLALLLEHLDRSIKNVEDVSRYLQLPSLGVIPAITDRELLMMEKRTANDRKEKGILGGIRRDRSISILNSGTVRVFVNPMPKFMGYHSTAAEAFRLLRTSVLLLAKHDSLKTILVSSSRPGEGKTTTVVNTAISLAQLGASVLIIDCDLRAPKVHEVLGVDQSPGLTTYLSSDAKIDGLIQKLQVPNLSLLPCGPIPDNPAELISSEKLNNLLRVLAEQYDFILIDSPPQMNLADAVILSTLADGVLLVVDGGKSHRDVVRRARNDLTAFGARILGVVLNNVNPRNSDYYSHPYYSGDKRK